MLQTIQPIYGRSGGQILYCVRYTVTEISFQDQRSLPQVFLNLAKQSRSYTAGGAVHVCLVLN